MSGLVALGIALLIEPTAGDWRVITDDPGNAILAVETSGISGPFTRRVLTAVAASRETLEAHRYLRSQVAIDCHLRRLTLVSMDVKALGGDVLGSLNSDDLGSTTASTSEGSPTVVAFACDDLPVTTQSFGTDVEFITWASAQLKLP